MTDYVKNIDYATSDKGGVVKTANGVQISNGALALPTKPYSEYQGYNNTLFIGKGTLENVITGKGLVSNTDYATSSTGGVFKAQSTRAIQVAESGNLFAQIKTYQEYNALQDYAFIGKGTLENVLAKYYKKQVVLTQAQYDQITPDANTLYIITGA